jgi:NAD(P)-dependent dehydrogenase (short-subunit alcohol dehydrogenase family)
VPGALAGSVAIVTGAGRGIGRAHALELAGRGAAVVANDLGTALDGAGTDSAPAEQVAAEIVAAGGTAIADVTDIASLSGGRAVVTRAVEAFGRLDIVVNNAGYAHGGGTVAEPRLDELDALMAVHLVGALGTMSAAIPVMAEQRRGRIVNTVSEVALDPRFAGGLGYSTAKAALWSATIVAAREVADHGITVNAVSPGARTRMNDDLLGAGFRGGASAGLDLDPRHVARVVAFLVSEEAADVTGSILHVAGLAVREYTTARASRSELVERALAWLAADARC